VIKYTHIRKKEGEKMKKGTVTKQKNLFSIVSKEMPKDADAISHQLLLKAGFIESHAAGIYQYTPLGLSVLKKIEELIREEMREIDSQEVLLPALQNSEFWEKTGRIHAYGKELMQLKDRHDRLFILGPTHEEVITSLASKYIASHKNLPISVFQIQTKFRDEKRPRSGLLRGREFIMKDAYSFHANWECLDSYYKKMYQAYTNILARLEMNFRAVEADGGAISGEGETHEFMILSDTGEDTIIVCENCDYSANTEVLEGKDLKVCPKCNHESITEKKGIEVGHIFKLGTKYSTSLGSAFLNKDQKKQDLIMGCYGIGVSRLISAFVEQHHDEKGIIWTKEIQPYQVHILPIHAKNQEQIEKAQSIANKLKNAGYDVLLDDRDKNAGIKFSDAELIGIPIQIIIGNNGVDIKYRHNLQIVSQLTDDQLLTKIKEFYQ
jgi:prolyl-tRNA synthetase